MRFCRVIVLVSGFMVFMTGSGSAQMPEGGAPQAMPVTVAVVKPQAVKIWSEYSGRINAVDYVEVRPQVSGTITDIKFKDGDHVKKGDILFILDQRPYDAALRGAQAALQTAQNQLDLADKEVARANGLIKTNAISQRIFDERVNAWKVASSNLDAAKAALEQAQINFDYTSVKAPVSGYTSRAEVTLGNLVDPSASPVLTTIVSDSGVYADFEVDESTYLKAIRGADVDSVASKIDVEILIPSLQDLVYKGKIHSFDNVINPATGTIRVRAFIPNTDKVLIPGMFVKVKMGTSSDKNIIMVPEGIIGTDQDRKYVLVADKGKASYRPVTLGVSSAGQREILTGLAQGDQVIIDGLMHIRPDMPVAPSVKSENAAQVQQKTDDSTQEMPTPSVEGQDIKEVTPEDVKQ